MVLSKKQLQKPICTPGSAVKRTVNVSQATASTKMKVSIRVRPFNSKEEQMSECRSIIKMIDDKMLIFDPREDNQPFFFHGVKQRMRDITKKQNKEIEFIFDQVYGSSASNENVYQGSICGILPALLEGYNCSVFVYGATGAGKTHTMLGNDTSPGIIYLTMRALYCELENLKEEKHFDIGISYLEVYNENVHDLLNPSSGPLHLREDTVNGVIVAGMKLVQIVNADHLFELLREGNANRTQHPTDANAESSRSHAVFQVFIKIHMKNNDRVQIVKLSMIDLAGSERGAATSYKGMRFKEGSNINKSLLALGNCINNLADGVRHIPYRDSKLTRLLKDSLGGNCQTVMIACVGPTMLSYEDTYNTLKYAARARTIKTRIAKTVMSMETHVDHYKVIVQEQSSKIAQLELEIQRLRDAASQPIVGDVTSWVEKISTLYSIKKTVHQEILALESREKITRLRIKYKHNSAEQMSLFNNSDDQEFFNRIQTSVNRMEGAVTGLYTKISELWDRKIENDEKIDALRNELERNKLTDALAAEIIKHEAKIDEMESQAQIAHLYRVLTHIDMTNELQKNTITKMADKCSQYHTLLQGFNKITPTMIGELKDIKSMLKGKYNITWETSPSNEMKKREDMLKRYATLSIDTLKTDVKPCPLVILQEPEEEEETEDEEVAKESNENEKDVAESNDITFTIPVPPEITVSKTNKFNDTFTKITKSPRRLGRVTPMSGVKKITMKENVKPLQNGFKRLPATTSLTTQRKVPILPPFKTPKVPLAAKNKNL